MDWICCTWALVARFMLARHNGWGWAVAVVGAVPWLYYMAMLEAWGLFVFSIILAVNDCYGFWNWRQANVVDQKDS